MDRARTRFHTSPRHREAKKASFGTPPPYHVFSDGRQRKKRADEIIPSQNSAARNMKSAPKPPRIMPEPETPRPIGNENAMRCMKKS